jgi:beta-galactosidase
LITAGEETVLNAIPEKTVLHAVSQELCYLPIEFTDQAGNLKPYIEQRVDIEVEGSVSLVGFGSALCKTNEVFHENHHDSYRGRCLAVLRAKDSPGKGTVTIKSAGVKPVTIEVEVK